MAARSIAERTLSKPGGMQWLSVTLLVVLLRGDGANTDLSNISVRVSLRKCNRSRHHLTTQEIANHAAKGQKSLVQE